MTTLASVVTTHLLTPYCELKCVTEGGESPACVISEQARRTFHDIVFNGLSWTAVTHVKACRIRLGRTNTVHLGRAHDAGQLVGERIHGRLELRYDRVVAVGEVVVIVIGGAGSIVLLMIVIWFAVIRQIGVFG